ncbi:YicC/YloC family endoribonuclease [Tropicibacter oceani]|uniref:YicC family protein n=1 Tax=Tropicibacter oceani TaxID=3058420 RepID=A0ABY8QFB1_9RHOB|nr:YicC/YloC family endoribonuclease [Tropicibacter oceani]WGW02882.1 YicC family protein [Tropicibacter oceani]
MRQSMTGFASLQGEAAGFSWTWELRGVNGKGLDLRMRLPDWIDGLEPQVRALAGKALVRGNVQIALRITSVAGEGALRLDAAQLDAVLDAMTQIEHQAMAIGLSLAPSTASDIVGLRGVMTSEAGDVDQGALLKALMADFEQALAAFVDMRRAEGVKLAEVLSRQCDEIAALVDAAETQARAREGAQADKLRAQLARVMDNSDGMDAGRIAQELALIAVKADVTEEIDRLRAHVTAARDLLAEAGSVGRKLDFLMQEFNREANTLCSKSGDAALTRTGLALKTVIEQMREQVQNVE